MRFAGIGRRKTFETDVREMSNRFGTGSIDPAETLSGEDRNLDAEGYYAERITDFSRAKSMMQHSSGEALQEKEQTDQENEPQSDDNELLSDDREFYRSRLQELGSRIKDFEIKLYEIRRLQEDLRKVEIERETLSARLGEIEEKNIQSEEDLRNILAEKREIEERNQALQSANEAALDRIRILTQEKEEAVLGESEAMEKYLQMLKENDDLSAEISNLRSLNERLSGEIDRELRAEQSGGESTEETDCGYSEATSGFDEAVVSEAFEERYGKDLMTDSGRELFLMLRGLLQDDARDDNGVRMTKLWEEELEETIPGTYPDEPPMTRRVRTKSEVSVEYIAGRRNAI